MNDREPDFDIRPDQDKPTATNFIAEIAVRGVAPKQMEFGEGEKPAQLELDVTD